MVNLSIINASGRCVKTLINKVMQAGTYEVKWDAGRVGGGMYYCRLKFEGKYLSRTLVLQR
jgi:hypothetical protein